MSHLLSNLTAAALLVHALLGCCWHHAHQCQHAPTAVQHGGPAVDCHDGACCEHSRLPEPSGDEQHGDDGCADGPCAFLRPQSDSAALEFLVQPHDTAAVVAALTTDSTEVSCGREPPSLSAGLCPALRLHLLKRVLLI